jgi:hypothetical protein
MSFIFNGTTINAAYFNGTALTQIVFNGVPVWNSAPTIGLFYGGFNGNIVTRINSSGTLIGSETNVGTARSGLSGASAGNNGLFYGGSIFQLKDGYLYYNIVNRINSSGASVGSETNVGTARAALSGATVGGNGLFYGGDTDVRLNTVTRINSSGALVGSETNVGTARAALSGATVGGNGLFYGGNVDLYPSIISTRINSSGALVGSETNVGTRTRFDLAGATVGDNGVFYGGTALVNSFYAHFNIVTRINSSGTLVGSDTNVGTGRSALGGATVGDNGVFYGGATVASDNAVTNFNTVTRINSSGALVGSQTNIGTARRYIGGAGI